MKRIGLSEYIAIAAKQHRDDIHSPIFRLFSIKFDSYYIRSDLPSYSDMITKVLCRWIRINKVHIRVHEYNKLCQKLARQFSGNWQSTCRSAEIDDRPRKLVIIREDPCNYGFRKTYLRASTNRYSRTLYDYLERYDRFHEYIKSRVYCIICDKSMDKDKWYASWIRRKPLTIQGSQLRASNFLIKCTGKYTTNLLCINCHRKTRSLLQIHDEHLAINDDLKALRRELKT